jgi:flagellar biosynthesis GTPase FlhF
MSITAASAENTMNYVKERKQELSHEKDDVKNTSENKTNDGDEKIYFKPTGGNGDSDDDMIVIILDDKEEEEEKEEEEKEEEEKEEEEKEEEEQNHKSKEVNAEVNAEVKEEVKGEEGMKEEDKNKKKHCREYENNGEELFIQLRDKLTMKKLYPLLPCSMISSFAFVMEHVEYFDISSEERRKLVVDLVKSLAYSNNEYGSRECFDYFVQHNMVDDVIKTVTDCTKNKYDINRFPHTNRKIVLSCVSISNKVKNPKPIKFDSLFDFKINLCGLKRFFKMKEKEKDETKQV